MLEIVIVAFPFLPGSFNEFLDVGIVVGVCSKPVVLSEDVYWWLVERKFRLRVRSLDEVLRIEMPHMSQELQPDHEFVQVKVYSDEGTGYAKQKR